MLAFSNDYYGLIFRATQSVELFCAYLKSAIIYCFMPKDDEISFIAFFILDKINLCFYLLYKLIRRIDKEKIIEYTTMSDKVNEFAVSLFMRLWVEMQQV